MSPVSTEYSLDEAKKLGGRRPLLSFFAFAATILHFPGIFPASSYPINVSTVAVEENGLAQSLRQG
jgi:hypothetical protein